ncbi:transposase [Pseudomonas sp. SG20052]|uniref:transposase n=1 Tax=Pseudomonas sp. SG20052 TaxID=3074147 RepID=UPI00287F6DAE|nr:transposase [Pseudomonas sp. SG20052]WNF53164.1 transposase [Pseudomonas sp. SG20052]
MRIIRAIVAGERSPSSLAALSDKRCKAGVNVIEASLAGNYQPEHVFALTQALSMYDAYQAQLLVCDQQIAQTLIKLSQEKTLPAESLPKPRHNTRQPNALNFDVRTLLYQLVGVDLTQIHGIGPYLALRLVAECGTDLSRWRTRHHFTSLLTLAPGCRFSGQKSSDRPSALSRCDRRQNEHGIGCVGCVLSASCGSNRQSQGRHSYRPKDRDPVLQRHAFRHELSRPGSRSL